MPAKRGLYLNSRTALAVQAQDTPRDTHVQTGNLCSAQALTEPSQISASPVKHARCCMTPPHDITCNNPSSLHGPVTR